MKHLLQQKIVGIMSRCVDMTVATTRPDGAPQATVVSFVHDGLTVYFACSAKSQKAANISHEPRVSLTMTIPYKNWLEIEGLSIAATATEVEDANEISSIGKLIRDRFPEIRRLEPSTWDALKFFRLRPQHVSLLDYTRGFGHTERVTIGADDIAQSSEVMRHHWLTPANRK